MHEAYDWYAITSTQVGAFAVQDALEECVAGAAENAHVMGVFQPELGMPTTTRLCLVGWSGARIDLCDAFLALDDVTAVDVERLHATVRPAEIAPLVTPGVYVHIWFDFPADNWDDILRLSEEAWPTWEHRFDVEVVGVWRHDDDAPSGRALLISRYSSYAEWERSRMVDDSTSKDEAYRNFIRRFFLTDASVMYATQLVANALT